VLLREGEVLAADLGDPSIGVEGRLFARGAQDDVGSKALRDSAPTTGTIGPVLSARQVTNGKGPGPTLRNARAAASGRQPAIEGRTRRCRCPGKGRALPADAVAQPWHQQPGSTVDGAAPARLYGGASTA
jgi:hypothetical protein